MNDRYPQARAQFVSDTKAHAMTVLHDDGLYRHVRFKAPGTGFYWFDLVTWPGFLSFSGDMDGYVFARVSDMFTFFDDRYGINPDYWAEKVADGRERTKTYSEDRFRSLVTEQFADAVKAGNTPRGLGRAVREEILNDDEGELAYEDGARSVLNRFEYKGFRFHDTWEWDFREWDWTYLWACHAIQWGIGQYRAARAANAPLGVE